MVVYVLLEVLVGERGKHSRYWLTCINEIGLMGTLVTDFALLFKTMATNFSITFCLPPFHFLLLFKYFGLLYIVRVMNRTAECIESLMHTHSIGVIDRRFG